MFNDSKLYEDAYDMAARQSEAVVAEIEEFKKELQGVKQVLEENQQHLFQHIMAPLAGGKALIKAKLIHTNDILVFLGDKWFVRTSAARAIDICNRRIERCNVNIAEVEQQKKRFSSNKEVAREYDLFHKEDLQEIIEEYDEEAETLWKEKHKEKVREFKKQEAAERNQQNRTHKETDFESIESDEESDFYSSDETDECQSQCEEDNFVTENSNPAVQSSESCRGPDSSDSSRKEREESRTSAHVEREIANERTNAISKSPSSSDRTIPTAVLVAMRDSERLINDPRADSIAEGNRKSEPVPRNGLNNCAENDNTATQSSITQPEDNLHSNGSTSSMEKFNVSKKRVSFSTADETKCYSPLDSEDTNVISFSHSEAVSSSPSHEGNQIESPSDIYRLILQGFNLKSILKRSIQSFDDETSQQAETRDMGKTKSDGFHSRAEPPKNNEKFVIGEIIEKNPDQISKIDTSSRNPSKFRKARIKG